MFVKSDIRKITIAFEKKFYADVYLALGQAGIIHLARFQEGDTWADGGLQDEELLIGEITSATDYALHMMKMGTQEGGFPAKSADVRKDAAFARGIKKTLERITNLQTKLREASDRAARQMESLEALKAMGVDPETIKKPRLVKVAFGTLENIVGDVPPSAPFMMTGTGRYILGVSLPADFPDMLRFLKEKGFMDRIDDVPPSTLEDLQKHADSLARRRSTLDEYLNRLVEEKGAAVQQMNGAYRANEQMIKAMRLSLFSSRAMFVTGWMDLKDKDRLIEILQTICGNRFVLSEKKDPEAPVRLMNVRWFKPFELLVKTMGMPSNSEVDPTPLTAVTFALMFGFMFGDLGQGLVLVLGGIILRRIGRKKVHEELTQAGGILMVCGISAAACGILYGSFFSNEHLMPALWFHPTAHIMKLFFVTILMGAVFIIAGLCVNIINSFLNADYTEALFDKHGLSVLVLYASIVLMVLYYQKTGQFPPAWVTGPFMILPLALFSLRGVLGPALFHSAKPHGISEYIIETVMEIVEIGLSLFANTISFIRVGAFALSHAGLSIVTYTLAGIVDPSLKSAGAIIVIIIGNIFIIGFEGMICGIQSMRLEYYEFFSKFFKGEGVLFTPFTLKTKVSEV